MAIVNKTFTGIGDSEQLYLRRGESLQLDISGSFVAIMVLEYTHNGGSTWIAQSLFDKAISKNFTAVVSASDKAYYRLRCSSYDSGSVVTSIADVADKVLGETIKDNKGNTVMRVEDNKIVFPKAIEVEGESGFTSDSDTDLSSKSWFLDEDNLISDDPNKAASQQSVKAYIDSIGGGLSTPMAYDANTNTPDLDTSPSGISAGDFYYITADGTFFTEPVEVSDLLISKQANPTILDHWIVAHHHIAQAVGEVFKVVNASLITSLAKGCEVTINGDTTKLDIAVGSIYITDHTDKVQASGSLISVAAVTIAITASEVQRVQITSGGVVQVVPFTGNLTLKEKINGLVQIAVVSSLNLVDADGVAVTISALYGSSVDSTAALFAAGTKVLSGGILILNTDLTMDRVATTQFDCFAPNFYTDAKNAYEVTFSEELVFSFGGAYQDGSGGTTLVAPGTSLNVTKVDDGSGTLDDLSGNEAQNFRVYEIGFVGEQRFIIEHGQTTHANLAAAVNAAESDSEVHNTSIFAIGTIFRGYISCPRAATNLLTDAVYTKPRTRDVTVFA